MNSITSAGSNWAYC